jgi:hypothetical protein
MVRIVCVNFTDFVSKGKLKLSLCLFKPRTMTCGQLEVQLREVSGQFHGPAALPLEESPPVSFE